MLAAVKLTVSFACFCCHITIHITKLPTDTDVFQPSYGVKTKECELAASEAEKIILSKFDEDNLYEHMMKILFGCGMYAAFRGRKEHTYFYTNQLRVGFYPNNFENKELVGLKYVAIDHMPDEKCNKITVHNSYSKCTTNFMRFPIMAGDPNNFGGALHRLMEKFVPGQKRVYCKRATPEKRTEWLEKGYPKAEFFATLHLGEKKISKLFKKGAEILGIKNVKNFKPHSLRGACITTLVNSKDVSLAETMRVARHSSVSASKVYQRVDGISEGNRLSAFGQMPTASKKGDTKKGVSSDDDDDVSVSSYSSGSSMSTIQLGLGKDGKRKSSDCDSTGSVEEIKKPAAKRRKNEEEVRKSYGKRNKEEGRKTAGMRKNEEYYDESTSYGGMTQEGILELKDDIARLHDQMRNGFDTRSGSDPQLTQIGIGELYDDLENLRNKLNRKSSPAPMQSRNSREVAKLREIVKSLSRQLEDQQLYTGSLEHDVDVRVEELEEEVRRERRRRMKAEMENKEYQEFIFRDEDRGKRR